MRRQLMVGVVGILAAMMVIGTLVFASQQGWFGGKAQQLMA